MTRFLFIGDPHIKSDNHDAIAILLREIDRILDSRAAYDGIVVAGDVMHYHERLFTPALNCALHFLDHLRRRATTYVLVGNHDAINNSIFLTDQHWMNVLKSWDNLVVVDRVVTSPSGHKKWAMCPYVPPGRFVEALETKMRPEEWHQQSVIFAHQEFRGCRMGAIVSTEGDEWAATSPLVLSGHIHDHQRVGENVFYPGTPLQHAFGDTDTRVVVEVDLSGNAPLLTEFPLNVPKKRIVKTDTMTELTKSVEKILTLQTDQTAVKVKAELSADEYAAFKKSEAYQQLVEKGVKFQLAARRETATRSDVRGGFATILAHFVEEDEPIVAELYNEVVLERLVLF